MKLVDFCLGKILLENRINWLTENHAKVVKWLIENPDFNRKKIVEDLHLGEWEFEGILKDLKKFQVVHSSHYVPEEVLSKIIELADLKGKWLEIPILEKDH